MNREVVQDFLNLPGIVGVALMDGRSRPYFCGVDRTLNLQQKEALAQGIQQVVATTPTNFQSFEFRFAKHQVHIYKLKHGIVLLVLGNSDLANLSNNSAVELLKDTLQEDMNNVISTFRRLVGAVLSESNDWKQGSTAPATSPEVRSAVRSSSAFLAPSHSIQPATTAVSTSVQNTAKLSPALSDQLTLKDLLSALNHLNQFTTRYLGVTVITNYWKSTRPAIEWLNHFQLDRAAGISFSETISPNNRFISSDQHQWVQAWVVAFIHRCSKVIRDFPQIIKQTALDDRQKHILLPDDF